MIETALPNLHPAVVHFPIALLPLALLLDVVSVGRRSNRGIDQLATTSWMLAAIAVTAAFIAGRIAADGLVGVPPQVQPRIGDHADWAGWLVGMTWSVAILRAAIFLADPKRAGTAARLVVVVLGVGLQAVLFVTADKGGALVYEHAVAVKVSCPACEAPPPMEAGSPVPVTTKPDGTHVWAPALAIPVSGSHTILLEPELDDVQVNAMLDLQRFEGEVAVLHHSSGSVAGAFRVATNGQSRLVWQRNGGEEVLDSGSARPSFGTISVSAAGSHLKGLVDGTVVTHGHGQPLPPGRVGLRLDGSGVVGITRIEAIPLKRH